MTLEQAIELGFDLSKSIDGEKRGAFRIRCSQCEVLVINGLPCHETGCPNQTHECKGCDTIVPRGVRYCEDCA